MYHIGGAYVEPITVENDQGPPGTPYDPATPRLNTLKKLAHKDLYKSVHSSIVHNNKTQKQPK